MLAFFGLGPEELVLPFAIALVMIVVPTLVAVVTIVMLGRHGYFDADVLENMIHPSRQSPRDKP
jgi:hypothetical protein